MKRILMYIVLILLAFMLQNNFFATVTWINITPNLILIITFIFGFIRGRVDGMLIGFFGGLLTDFFFGTSVGYYALIYLFIGYFNGVLGSIFYDDYLNTPILLCIANDLVFSLYVFVTSFLLNGVTNFGYYLIKIILPEIVYTSVITLIVYRPLQGFNKWIEKIEKRSAKKFV